MLGKWRMRDDEPRFKFILTHAQTHAHTHARTRSQPPGRTGAVLTKAPHWPLGLCPTLRESRGVIGCAQQGVNHVVATVCRGSLILPESLWAAWIDICFVRWKDAVCAKESVRLCSHSPAGVEEAERRGLDCVQADKLTLIALIQYVTLKSSPLLETQEKT